MICLEKIKRKEIKSTKEQNKNANSHTLDMLAYIKAQSNRTYNRTALLIKHVISNIMYIEQQQTTCFKPKSKLTVIEMAFF